MNCIRLTGPCDNNGSKAEKYKRLIEDEIFYTLEFENMLRIPW